MFTVPRRNAPDSFQSCSALLRLQPQVLGIKAFDMGSQAELLLLLSALLKIKAPQGNMAPLLKPLLPNPSPGLYRDTGSSFVHVCKWGGQRHPQKSTADHTLGHCVSNRRWRLLLQRLCWSQQQTNSVATMGARLGVFLPSGLAGGKEKDV